MQFVDTHSHLHFNSFDNNRQAVLDAAKQAGIKTVIVPARNKKDIPDIPTQTKKGLKFQFAKNTRDVLKIALDTES